MKTRMGIISILLFPFLLTFCSKNPEVEDVTVEEEEVVEVTGADTVEPAVEEPVTEETTPPPPPPTGTETYGYRVQVGAFKNRSGADMQAARARTAFPGHQVYTVFIEDWNKVWVGDFLTRKEAEIVRDEANTRGFPGSFLVETTINR